MKSTRFLPERPEPLPPRHGLRNYISGVALLKLVRRAVIFFLGISVLIVGGVMIVTPGPAFLVIPLGLTILATEFVWARRLLESLKKRLLCARNGSSPPAGG